MEAGRKKWVLVNIKRRRRRSEITYRKECVVGFNPTDKTWFLRTKLMKNYVYK